MTKLEIKDTKNKDDIMAVKVFKRVERYLEKQNFNYSLRPNGSPEVVLHGDNLIMLVNYHFYNGHLIIRVPNFIKNVDIMRPKIMFLINQLMEETLSIRFELEAERGSISATCHHVVEDNLPTYKQLELLTMLLVSVVDDSYHKFMQAIYGPDGSKSIEATLDRELGEFTEEFDGYERPDVLKIN
jgi:hypothetical protein